MVVAMKQICASLNERESQKDKDDSKPSYCYFLKQREYVKIGQSLDPIRSAKQINHYSPYRTKLLHYTALVDEATAHKRFQSVRHTGEWFELTAELQSYINALIERDMELESEN